LFVNDSFVDLIFTIVLKRKYIIATHRKYRDNPIIVLSVLFLIVFIITSSTNTIIANKISQSNTIIPPSIIMAFLKVFFT